MAHLGIGCRHGKSVEDVFHITVTGIDLFVQSQHMLVELVFA